MADTTYTDGATVITANTMNDLNRLHYTILADPADAAAVRTALGVATADSPQFTGVNIGHASDTTITRASAGTVAVEGVNVLTTATGAALAGSASQNFAANALSVAGLLTHTLASGQVVGNSGATTGAVFGKYGNTTGAIYWGVEDSTGSGVLIAGASANDASLMGKTGLSLSGNNGANLHMRIANTAAGNVTFSGAVIAGGAVSGTTLTTTSGQIVFPATQNPSADVHTLDDYEEGTWTPSVGGSATYTTQSGTYIKIGGMVSFRCALVINVIGTGSTSIISGLPFTSQNTFGTPAACVFSGMSQSVVYAVGFVLANSTTIAINSLLAAATATNTNAVIGNTTQIYLEGHYFV